jgi:hypothetical protein
VTYVAGLAAAAGIGDLVAEPVVLKRGAVACWRVTTSRGDFHLKRFAVRDPALAACAEVERAAQRAGVSLAEPIALGVDVGDEVVHVHRWWPGRPLEPGDDIAGWLGAALARLHTLPPPSSAPVDALTSYYGLHPEAAWRTWFRAGRSRGLAWAEPEDDEPLAAVLAASDVIAAGLASESRRAGTHRDLLGANILRNGAELALIDWDCAGPDVPWFEAVRAAVEFGRLAATVDGMRPLQPDPGVSRAILAAYEQAGGERGVTGRRGLAGVLGMAVWRIAFAVQVSLGDGDERVECTAYLPGALAKLVERVRTLEPLAAAVGL